MRRFKIAGDLIALAIPVLQALPKILDLLFLILLCAERCGQPARERRRSRLKHVRLSRVLGPTVLDVGPQLTLA